MRRRDSIRHTSIKCELNRTPSPTPQAAQFFGKMIALLCLAMFLASALRQEIPRYRVQDSINMYL